jgi:hypothetical protein
LAIRISKASNAPLFRRHVESRVEGSRFVLKPAVSFLNAG